MAEQRIVVVSQVTIEPVELTLEEMSNACNVTPEVIIELVTEGAIDPAKGKTPEEWRFDILQLRRVRTVLHLFQDLEINFAGAALVMDLMEQMAVLRTQLELLEKLNR